MKTILVLAANPKGTSQLRLDQEVREINYGLQRAQRRDEFTLKEQWAARPIDVRRAMLDYKPNIVHFCGHGQGPDGIAFEDELGNAKLVQADALAGLFELFSDTVECVLLNACYSDNQAPAIARHIHYVLGMEKAIEDTAAIEFAVAFYDALGVGKSYEFAYKFGCNAIRMAGIPDHLTPKLVTKGAETLVVAADENDPMLQRSIEREVDNFDSFYSTTKRTGIDVHIYWHETGFTFDDANSIRDELEREGISVTLIQHMDPSLPDAIFVGALVSAWEARTVLSRVSHPIRYIFPLDYPRVQGGDPNGLLIGIGYMSTHNLLYYRARETTPIEVSQSDITSLIEPDLSNTEFQLRLRNLLDRSPVWGERGR